MKTFFKKESNLEQFYWQYFGLIKDPFADKIDLEMCFVPPTWEQYLDLMQYWLSNENILTSIVAGKGLGKSTLLNLFYAQLFDVVHVEIYQASAQEHLNALIETLIQKFNLENHHLDSIEEQLDDLINQLQFKNKPCVFLIDEAGLLPEETINALIYLLKQQSQTQMRFHVFLFGDIELQTKLAQVAKDELNRDFVKNIELLPFTLEETRRYIMHRLNKAGLHEPLPLKDYTIERIYEMSQGNPEDINKFSTEFMLDELDRQKSELNPSFIQTYQTHLIGAGVIVAVLAVIGLVFLKSPTQQKTIATANNTTPSLNFAVNNGVTTSPPINPSASQNPPPQFAMQQNQSSLGNSANSTNVNKTEMTGKGFTPQTEVAPGVFNSPSQPVLTQKAFTPSSSTSTNQNALANSTGQQGVISSIPQGQKGFAVGTIPNSSTTSKPQSTFSSSSTPVSVSASQNVNVLAKPNDVGNVKSVAPLMPVAQTPHQYNQKEWLTSQHRKTAPLDQSVLQGKVEKSHMGKSVLQTNTEKFHASKNRTEPTNAAEKSMEHHNNKEYSQQESNQSKVEHSHQHREKALKSKHHQAELASKNESSSNVSKAKHGRYTLQLAALASEEAVKKFAREHGLANEAHYAKHIVNGKTYYVLQYGAFSSIEAAKEAKSKLPGGLARSAWVRKNT